MRARGRFLAGMVVLLIPMAALVVGAVVAAGADTSPRAKPAGATAPTSAGKWLFPLANHPLAVRARRAEADRRRKALESAHDRARYEGERADHYRRELVAARRAASLARRAAVRLARAKAVDAPSVALSDRGERRRRAVRRRPVAERGAEAPAVEPEQNDD